MHICVLKAVDRNIGPDDRVLFSPAVNAIHLATSLNLNLGI